MAMQQELSALVALKVQPRASADAVVGERDGLVVVRIKAPPHDGQANAALLRFLARRLGIPQRDVELVRGGSARLKWVRVLGLSEAAVREALLGNS
jgi:uncharacterized protein